jgi:hypothetical protein
MKNYANLTLHEFSLEIEKAITEMDRIREEVIERNIMKGIEYDSSVTGDILSEELLEALEEIKEEVIRRGMMTEGQVESFFL